MTRHDAIRQLKGLRQEAISRACPRSRLAIQEYADTATAVDDVVALGMAIRALRAPARRDMPVWACALWCVAAAVITVACLIYAAG